jgi:hypothetical protein
LPVTESINQKPSQPPPTQGTRTSQWRVSKVDRDYTDGFSELAFAASYHDLTSRPEGKTRDTVFIALDTRFGIFDDEVNLGRFTFIEVGKYQTTANSLKSDGLLSWRLNLGYESGEYNPVRHGLFGRFGIGKSIYLGGFLSYAMLDTRYNEHAEQDLKVSLALGLVFRPISMFALHLEVNDDEDSLQTVLRARVSVNAQSEVLFDYIRSSGIKQQVSLSYAHYW